MRDGDHFPRIHFETSTQSCPSCTRHHHDLVGQGRNLSQDGFLVRRRITEDGVGDHDGWDSETGQDLEHFVAVRAAVEAVLVLHHRDVANIEELDALSDGVR